ncbi:MAG: hypothetical protein LBG80_00815 [Bacteroidales bacterium]|jgi:preprotein translocase subunit YajC|nr:hypothetical protein [Bacteroidales bacterium]
MKKRVFLFITGIILMVVISFLFIRQQENNREELTNTYQLSPDEIASLQEGDIIFRHGFGLISDAIVRCSEEDFPISHCGIIVKDSAGNLFVIHTVSNTLAAIDGLQKDNLKTFVKGSCPNSMLVTRYNYENDTLQKQIAEQANFYLLQQIPFDHHFDCSDTTAFFCTEFIRNVFFNAIHVDLYDEQKRDCMSFSPLYNPMRFTIVLNHHEL